MTTTKNEDDYNKEEEEEEEKLKFTSIKLDFQSTGCFALVSSIRVAFLSYNSICIIPILQV